MKGGSTEESNVTDKPRDDEERDELDDEEFEEPEGEDRDDDSDGADAKSGDADDSDDPDAKSDDADDDEPVAKAEDKARPKPTKKRRKKKARPAAAASTKSPSRDDRPKAFGDSSAKKTDAKGGGGSNAVIYALVALVAGAAIGWFARDAKGAGGVDATQDPSVAAAPSGSAAAGGPCDKWTATICQEAGETGEACGQAKAAAGLIPPEACQTALANVPATLAKVKNARSTCQELVDKLCKDIGEDTDSCKLVREKTPSFPSERCKQMMGEYDKVLGSLQAMEKKNAPLSPEVAKAQAAGDVPSFGPDDAKVTVVEYSDFQCPYCTKAAAVVKKLKENYADKVRFVFRQYPLPMHPDAPLASEAALAAHEQGKFWPMHDKLFENQRALSREDLEKYAQEIGLNMGKFKEALDSDEYADEVKRDMELGQKVGVSGTPTMIVGTKRVANPTDYATVSKMIDEQLAAN